MIEIIITEKLEGCDCKMMSVIKKEVFDTNSEAAAGVAVGYLITTGQIEGVAIEDIASGKIKVGAVKL